MATVNVALPNAVQPAEPWLVTEQKVRAAVERIVSIARPQTVIVFGSYARGQAKPGSDLDVVVIVDDTLANCRAESVRLRRTLRGISMPIDIVVARRSDVERLRYEVRDCCMKRPSAKGGSCMSARKTSLPPGSPQDWLRHAESDLVATPR